MLRQGDDKLIYHVNMPAEFYNLHDDPHELHDLADHGTGVKRAKELETLLRERCDPEAVNARCKAEQKARVMEFGGNEAILKMGSFVRTPPPGVEAEMLDL